MNGYTDHEWANLELLRARRRLTRQRVQVAAQALHARKEGGGDQSATNQSPPLKRILELPRTVGTFVPKYLFVRLWRPEKRSLFCKLLRLFSITRKAFFSDSCH